MVNITAKEKKNKDGLESGGKWMASSSIHKGGLHESLHIPQGEKIPAKKIAKAEKSSNPKIRKQATLAETFKKFRPH